MNLQISCERSADEPARLAAAVARRLQHPLESVRLEQADGAHIGADLVDTVDSRLYGVTLNHDRPAGACVLNRAVEQIMHQSPAPEARANHEADHRPGLPIVNVRNGP